MSKQKKRKINNLQILVGIVVILVLTAFVFISQPRSTINNQPKIFPTPSPIVRVETSSQEISSYIQQIFRNEIEHNKEVFPVGYILNSYNYHGGSGVGVEAFKYEKGNSILFKDEDLIDPTDISLEVENFPKLRIGAQKLTTCAGLHGCANSDVTGYKFGSRMWGSTDRYSVGTWDRIYYTYDKNTQQIIYVKVSFYNVTNSDVRKGVLNVYPEFKDTLQKVEKEILTF